MPMPAVPRASLVVSKSKLRLSRLERVLDRPTAAFNHHQRVDPSSGRTPSREEGQFAIREVAPDQQAARPQAREGLVVLGRIQVGQLAVSPIIEPLAFRAVPRGEALPGRRIETLRDLLGRAGHDRRLAPGGERIGGVRAQHIALPGPSQRHLDLANPVDRVSCHPAERNRGRIRPLTSPNDTPPTTTPPRPTPPPPRSPHPPRLSSMIPQGCSALSPWPAARALHRLLRQRCDSARYSC